METNELPKYDMSDNPTGCCPRFKPENWEDQELHFENKLFMKAKTKSFFHIPLNFGSVFPKAFKDMQEADAYDDQDFIILSCDPSMWTGEHYFAAENDVPGYEMVKMTGDFVTKVFEGPYKNAPKWEKEMENFVRTKGKEVKRTYFFYTTCPKCAKVYGKNYLVAVAEIQ